MLTLIARRSKYYFWIPDEILTLEIKIQIKKYFFEIENFVSRVKISSGIQKSYLERRAMNATMLKMQVFERCIVEKQPQNLQFLDLLTIWALNFRHFGEESPKSKWIDL